jgi:uncharacterized protein (TIGR03435 family)
MMQSLLADRFKVQRHTERQTQPTCNLVPVKAGRIGPQLRVHAERESCSAPSTSCHRFRVGSIGVITASAPGRGRIGGRRVTIERIASFLKNPFTGLDRPVRDRTGLNGTFDFTLEWQLFPDGNAALGSAPDDGGPKFIDALREQLGFTLKSATGSVDVLVIDHIEQPSAN